LEVEPNQSELPCLLFAKKKEIARNKQDTCRKVQEWNLNLTADEMSPASSFFRLPVKISHSN